MFSANRPLTKNFILSILFGIALCFFLYLCRDVLVPFVISAFFAYLFSPVVNKIMFFGLKRWVAVVILTAAFFALLILSFVKIGPLIYGEIDVFVENLPSYTRYVKDASVSVRHKISGYIPADSQNDIIEKITDKTSDIAAGAVKEISYLLKKIFSLFYIIIFLPVLTFFMLLEYDRLKKAVMDILPARYVEPVISVYYEASSVFSKYIRGQIIEVLFVGCATVIGLSVLGVNYAFLIGMTAGICNLIPYLGPLVGFVMGVIVTAVQFQSFAMVLKVMILFLAIQQLDNHVIQPVVVGRNVNLSPVAMIFALAAGAEIFGILGMIFAVPFLALTKNIFLIFIKRYKRADTYGKSC